MPKITQSPRIEILGNQTNGGRLSYKIVNGSRSSYKGNIAEEEKAGTRFIFIN